MVGIDAKTGTVNSAPYLALHKSRKIDGKLLFGQHMSLDGAVQGPFAIQVGDTLTGR